MVDIRPVTIHSYVECFRGFAHVLFTATVAFYDVDRIRCFAISRGFHLVNFPSDRALKYFQRFYMWQVLQHRCLHWELPLYDGRCGLNVARTNRFFKLGGRRYATRGRVLTTWLIFRILWEWKSVIRECSLMEGDLDGKLLLMGPIRGAFWFPLLVTMHPYRVPLFC